MSLKQFAYMLTVTTSMALQSNCHAQNPPPILGKDIAKSLELRELGPAFMSGRISDIAIHPKQPHTWYIGVGSGGVWKTNNAGVQWQPIFDEQSVYSIGALAIDPNAPETIWVGTGENVGGRHVSFGDGVYRSLNGGKDWQNMGLKNSEHISKIIVHPKDSKTLWVAAQGPLWSSGGERGLYLSRDGGKSWKKTLGDKEWTGVTDLVIHPKNPDILFAATWQRHRTVASYMGGGPKTALYRSDDGGESWRKLSAGLPKESMGKIGLGISPINPDIVYAAIELHRRQGAIYRSDDGGNNWQKMSDTVSGGTGPHYYQELYVSPHKLDLIYLADVWLQVSEDGGKTFRKLENQQKHSDHHALAFKDDDPNFMLLGSDGGLYESYDKGDSWRYVENLPTLQFYKVAVDDAKPFYNIYGGTQDNASQRGPSRTLNNYGIQNADWSVVLSGDGHQPATEPGTDKFFYAQWQQGQIHRIDSLTGEKVSIRPQPGKNDPIERVNWDAPIVVDPSTPQRIYFGSQRLWRSDDRGDSWTAISPDLTRNETRLDLPIMGRKWGWNAHWDVYAMSDFNTITNISPSPKDPNLVYVGTDDGIIQITEDGGKSWRKVDVESLPDVPARAFVNDIKADRFNTNRVYVALDHHKEGDFKPYVYVSDNRGRSWRSLRGNLPDNHLAWRIVQDPKKANILYLGTEFGLFVSLNSGKAWTKLGNLPTISVRDIAIHERENDLIVATFGRGIWVLDDLSPLQEFSPEINKTVAHLFPVRDAWWYIEKQPYGFGKYGFQGASKFFADNPPYGAVFQVFVSEDLKSASELRKENEAKSKDLNKFPSWQILDQELSAEAEKIWLLIEDEQGKMLKRIPVPAKKGFQKVSWNLKQSWSAAVTSQAMLDQMKNAKADWDKPFVEQMAAPGSYRATLILEEEGQIKTLGKTQTFEVKRLHEPYLKGQSFVEQEADVRKVRLMQESVMAAGAIIDEQKQKIELWKAAIQGSAVHPKTLAQKLHIMATSIRNMEQQLRGSAAKRNLQEKKMPTINDRMSPAIFALANSSYGLTPNHRSGLILAEEQLKEIGTQLTKLVESDIPSFERQLDEVGVPWTPGRPLPIMGTRISRSAQP
ncbi:BNR-Asp box repeat-containing protein [Pseudobacteriovorax antillogorgiicola]|uniref:BNR-Asp box repeat-containing protein n=2 Tax=Pseudobacteriovorax antillogorgiicola TaxID=1513793 RepID=A0A1Y6BB53_9BACT|nr:BNR-Asp box repeat protein [Pseudobacteriovorax antillogorgiicola]SME94968.1 BNR-Asp box repeat-containing protein [Pseudobacteriovorax antillogorgiicola]